jgi:hypothetical protein
VATFLRRAGRRALLPGRLDGWSAGHVSPLGGSAGSPSWSSGHASPQGRSAGSTSWLSGRLVTLLVRAGWRARLPGRPVAGSRFFLGRVGWLGFLAVRLSGHASPQGGSAGAASWSSGCLVTLILRAGRLAGVVDWSPVFQYCLSVLSFSLVFSVLLSLLRLSVLSFSPVLQSCLSVLPFSLVLFSLVVQSCSLRPVI